MSENIGKLLQACFWVDSSNQPLHNLKLLLVWGCLIDVNAEVYHRSVNASRRVASVGVDEQQADSLLHPSSAASPPLPQLQERLFSAQSSPARLLLFGLSCSRRRRRDAVDGPNRPLRSALIPFCNRASLSWSQSARRCSPEESDRRGRLCGLNM